MAGLFLRGGGRKLLDDTIIRMVVAFVAGELPRRLLPLSRRFVPEPVQMSYIVTDGIYRQWGTIPGAFRDNHDVIRRTFEVFRLWGEERVVAFFGGHQQLPLKIGVTYVVYLPNSMPPWTRKWTR